MQKKSVERLIQQKQNDRKLGIIADSSKLGPKKVMQGYFEKKDAEKRLISK